MRSIIQFLLGVCVLFVPSEIAFGNIQETKIKGVIKGVQADGAKLPLAGAVVTIHGVALAANASLMAITDADGRFTLFNLEPGDYTLTVECKGFETYSKKYKLLSGAVATLGIDLKLQATTDVVDVKAKGDELSKTESSSVGILQEKTFKNAPLVNEQFQDALPLLPGVVRGPDGLLNIKGARASQSGLLVNSSNVTDPVTGNYAISLPIEAIESVTVLSNPYSAEYGKFTGAVTAIGTRSGGDNWRFLFTNFIPRFRRRTDPNTGKSKLVGIESLTPRLIVTGPIIKNKLTISQSFQYQFIRTRVPSLPNFRNDTQIEVFDSFTQIDYHLNDRNHVTGVLSFFPQNLQSVNLNTFNPIEVSPNFRQRGFFLSTAERTAFHNATLLELNFAVKRFNAFVFPNGNEPMNLAPSGNSGNYFNRQDRFTTRYENQAVYNFAPLQAGGEHLIKIGTNFSYNTFEGREQNHLIRVVNDQGILSQTIDFEGSGRLHRNAYEVTEFVQDKFTVKRNLVLDLGLRYDRDGLSEQNNFAPRFGFVIVPFSNGKTVVRGGIGLFYDKVPLGVGAFEQMQNRLVTTFLSDGTIFYIRQNFQNRIFKGLRTPYSGSATVEVDQQILKHLFFRFSIQRREGRNEFIIVPPTTDRTSHEVLLLTNGGISSYREAQFTTKYRFTESSDLTFSYVRSKATGDLNDFNTFFGNFRSPVIRNGGRSRLPFDAPNRFLIVGNIELPCGLVASPVLDVHNGFPYSQLNAFQDFVGPRNPDEQRFPQFGSLDLQVTKKFVIPFRGKRLITRVGVKIFNLTNHFNPRDVQSNIDSPAFGGFYNSVNRTVRGKFEFDF